VSPYSGGTYSIGPNKELVSVSGSGLRNVVF
jgi:hypothetical protein